MPTVPVQSPLSIPMYTLRILLLWGMSALTLWGLSRTLAPTSAQPYVDGLLSSVNIFTILSTPCHSLPWGTILNTSLLTVLGVMIVGYTQSMHSLHSLTAQISALQGDTHRLDNILAKINQDTHSQPPGSDNLTQEVQARNSERKEEEENNKVVVDSDEDEINTTTGPPVMHRGTTIGHYLPTKVPSDQMRPRKYSEKTLKEID